MLLSVDSIGADKSFDGVTCKTDMPSALIGRYMPNEKVMTTETRHKDIGLKDLGAYGMEKQGDPWTLISWQICEREYVLLERRGIVKDVLASPLPSGSPESKIVSCSVDGSIILGTSVAFVSSDDQKWPKHVDYAWFINGKTIKFTRIEGKEIVCEP